jgi:PAS domain S-box-containing protein
MAHLGSWWIEFDEPGKIESSRLSWSEEVFRIFGYEPNEVPVTNDLFFSHVHADDREQITRDVAKAISDCCPYDIEHRIITKDGKEKIIHEYADIIYNEERQPIRIIGAAHDITRIKDALKERDALLLEVELEKEKLQTVIDTVPVEIWVFDKNKSLLFVNPAVKKGLGLNDTSSITLESILNRLDIRNLDGSKRTPEQSPVFKSLKGETVFGDELVTHLKTGETRFRSYSSSPIKNKQGGIFGVVVVVNDITEHKKSEEKILDLLRLSELRTAELNAIFDSMPDAVYIGSENGITHCNENALKMLGAESIHDLRKRIGELAQNFNIRWPETGIPLMESELQFFRALRGETVAEEVLATNAESGENIYIRSACAPIRQNGKIIGAVAVNTDITGKKKAENQIKNSLKEKEVLLRELYHRTKNNMQVISSILGLKAASIDDKATSDILEEMKNRILAIALVHQKLYQSHNLSRVDLKEYITDLIHLIDSSYAVHENRVNLSLDLESITVVIDMAIPCGLIINELVSNSLKYAFPADARGNVEIRLRRLPNGLVELIVGDNGIGMSEKSLNEVNKLGLQLVRIIAEDQLQAETKVSGKNGIKWTFRFNDKLYEERI